MRKSYLWSSRDRRRLGPALLLGMILLTGARTAGAQAAIPPTIDELAAKAARQGPLRVIVELKLDAPGQPTREAIAQAQDQVLQELAGTDHRVLRRFTTIPFMGIEMSAAALRRLDGSAHVASVREDRLNAPLGPSRSP